MEQKSQRSQHQYRYIETSGDVISLSQTLRNILSHHILILNRQYKRSGPSRYEWIRLKFPKFEGEFRAGQGYCWTRRQVNSNILEYNHFMCLLVQFARVNKSCCPIVGPNFASSLSYALIQVEVGGKRHFPLRSIDQYLNRTDVCGTSPNVEKVYQ